MTKLTDEQIIIALKSSKEAADTDEVRDFLDDVIECINRKNAEIERLKQIINEQDKEILKLQNRIIFWRKNLNYQPEKIKSEAIKDFAERLKKKVKMYNSEGVDEGDLIDDLLTVGETVEIIDKLVKEMTEG